MDSRSSQRSPFAKLQRLDPLTLAVRPPTTRRNRWPIPLVAVSSWLRALLPASVGADWRERMRVVLGATVGILATALVCRTLAGSQAAWPWLIAPLGASAVLVFGVPSSPLAQPWSVVAGNALSTLVGIACVRWVASPEIAAALAVGLAIALMFALRCLHPPGGASALLVVLNGIQDPFFALTPVLVNSVLLVAVGMLFNGATRRPYPHRAAAVSRQARDDEADAVDADLNAVLARYNQVLDISRDDLKALLQDTQLSAYQRKLANLTCGDIMSKRLITVGHQTLLQQAWALFQEHRIKALPVVNAAGGIVGIVTPADFMRAGDGDRGMNFETRLRKLRGWTDGSVSAGSGRVGDIMTRQVRVASVNRHLSELIPLFGSTGHHHIPIIDGADHLVGIVTQSDVVAALSALGPASRDRLYD